MTSCLAALFNERFKHPRLPNHRWTTRRDFVGGSAADELGVNPGPDLAMFISILDNLIERRILGSGGD